MKTVVLIEEVKVGLPDLMKAGGILNSAGDAVG